MIKTLSPITFYLNRQSFSFWQFDNGIVRIVLFFFNFLFYFGVYLINNIVIISGVHQMIQLHIHMYLTFFKFFPTLVLI